MTSRDRVIKTLGHERVDRAPRDLWAGPDIETSRAEELAEIGVRFPSDVQKPDFKYPRGDRARGKPYKVGEYTDAWGCTWRVDRPGTTGEVKIPPLADLSQLATYRPPLELLDATRFSRASRSCAATPRFVLARSETRPFERLQALRGNQAVLVDLAHGTREIRTLLGMLHDFFCREMELWAGTDVDGVQFMDDWGSEVDLLVSLDLWRELFKPLYRDYCEILREKDKFVLFHSDGNIATICPDLIEIGVDAINSELSCMDHQQLAAEFRGRITFWGGIDRRRTLPYGTPEDVRAAVRQVRSALDCGRGGVIAQCEWGPEVPLANIVAVFDEWLRPPPTPA